MAVKTLYLLNTTALTPDWMGRLQDGGTAPTAAVSTFGWTTGKTAVTSPFWQARIGATAAATVAGTTSSIAPDTHPTQGTGSGATTAGDSFRSPTSYAGVFASGNWTFTFGLRCTTSSSQAGHINFRVWASTDPNGQTGTRELTSGSVVGATVALSTTTTTFNSTATWAAPQITLANEYLFIQVEWVATVAGGSNSCDVKFYQSAATIATTDFQPSVIGPLASTDLLDTSAIAGQGNVFGSSSSIDLIDTAAITGGIIATGTLAATDIQDASAVSGAVFTPVTGTLAATDNIDTAAIAGTVVAAVATGTLAATDSVDTISASGGPSLWSPADLGSNLLVWLDASDAASITITGSGVARWNDKSGNTRHVDQTNDTFRPSYASNKITFTAQQHLLCNDFTAYPTVYDCFAIGRLRNAPGEFCILLFGGDSGMPMLVDSSGNFGVWNNGFVAAAGQTWAFGTEGLAYGSIHNTNNVTWSRDGNALTTTSTPVGTSQPSALSRSDYTQAWGDIYELIFVTYGSSLDTKQRLEGYAAWKWGLAALLPAGHPYKNAAPQPLPVIGGTLAVTESLDVSGVSGSAAWLANLTAADSLDTSNLTGLTGVVGALSATGPLDTSVVSGGIYGTGSIAATDSNDTSAIAGITGVFGGLSVVESIVDTAAVAGGIVGTGALATTDAPDQSAAVGSVDWKINLAVTEARDTAAATGAVLSPLTGTLAAQDATDHLVLDAGGGLVGLFASIDLLDAAALSGGIYGTGTVAATDPRDTSAVSGGVVSVGTLQVAENFTDQITAIGKAGAFGQLSVTEDSQDAASIIGIPGAFGQLSATEDFVDEAFVTSISNVFGSIDSIEKADSTELVGEVIDNGDLGVTDRTDVSDLKGFLGSGTLGEPVDPILGVPGRGVPGRSSEQPVDDQRVVLVSGPQRIVGTTDSVRVAKGSQQGRVSIGPNNVKRAA